MARARGIDPTTIQAGDFDEAEEVPRPEFDLLAEGRDHRANVEVAVIEAAAEDAGEVEAGQEQGAAPGAHI